MVSIQYYGSASVHIMYIHACTYNYNAHYYAWDYCVNLSSQLWKLLKHFHVNMMVNFHKASKLKWRFVMHDVWEWEGHIRTYLVWVGGGTL